MSAAVTHRYGFDDIRRFAAAIAAAAGLSPPRSLALASHLLWFDAAGAAALGITTLPRWVEAIHGGRIDPRATGRLISERTALAVLDGENGPAPLVLDRAGELAVEKAREAAVGVVRVVGVGLVPSAAPVAAGIAIGPMAGWVLGPERCWSLAVPTQGGLPLVIDSGLADDGPNGNPARAKSSRRDPPAPAATLLEGLSSAIESLLAAEGWLVAAVSVSALGPMATDRERLAAVGRGLTPGAGRLVPEAWESHRRRVQQHGVAIEPAAWKSLTQWARRLSVDVPEPLVSPSTVDRS